MSITHLSRTFIYTYKWGDYTYSHGGMALYGESPKVSSALWFTDLNSGTSTLASMVLNQLREGALVRPHEDDQTAIESYLITPKNRKHATETIQLKSWDNLTKDQQDEWLKIFIRLIPTG